MEAVDFWDSRAEKYARSAVGDERAYKEKLETTQRYFNTESMVFEFGCGTGTTALHHAPFVRKIIATDISPKMIEIARAKAEQANIGNVEFQRATLQDFEGEAATFDVVMAHNILHLLEDPETSIRRSYDLLKPGGMFVTSTACLGDSFSQWRLLLIVGKILRKVPYVNVLKRVTLEKYLRDAGFKFELEWRRKKQAAFIILKKPDSE